MKYHKAHLTRRLILDMCQDHELEEQTIMMLKVKKKLKEFNFFIIKFIYNYRTSGCLQNILIN